MENNNRLIPKLRFKEFEGDWKNKEFGELVRRSKAKYNPVTEILNLPCIELECLSQETGTLLKYFNSKEQKSIKNRFKKGDVLFGKLRPYLKKYLKAPYEGVCSSEIWVLEGVKLNNDYLYQLIQTNKFNFEVNITSGSKMPRAEWEYISSVKFKFPNIQEQQKIATFLTSVDTKIQQLTTKKQLLENYKKGLMQQIFSQQLRFKNDDGSDFSDWEVKKLGEISSKVSYGMNSAAITFDGKHKYLRITDIDEDSRSFIPKPLSSPDGFIEDKFKMKLNDIVFARTGASVGKSYLYNPKDGDLYYAGFLIKFNISKANSYFVYLNTFTESYNKWVKVYSMRSGQPGLNAEEYKNLKIKLPSLKEQQKIATYLSAIDNKIDKVQIQIEKTQAFKKGLLQQMFV